MTPAVMTAVESRNVLAGRHTRGEMREQPDLLARLSRHVAHYAGQTAEFSALVGGFDEVVFLAGACEEPVALLGKHAVESHNGLRATVHALVGDGAVEPGSAEENRRRLVFALSRSAGDPGLCVLAGRYAEAGATVVAVTGERRSPLGRTAALSVDVAAGLEFAACTTKSTTGLMFVVLALLSGLPKAADDAPGPGAAAITSANTSASACGYGVTDPASALAIAQLVAELLGDERHAHLAAAKLVDARRIAVVAAPRHLAAALETARLLRQAAGLTAEGLLIDEFLAGAAGGFDDESAVVIVGGGGDAGDESVRAARQELESRGVRVVLVCDDADVSDLCYPSLGTLAESLLATVRGQQLAVAAAYKLGIDPDRAACVSGDRMYQ